MKKFIATVNDGDPLFVKPTLNGLEIEARDVSDGYHTMHELYQHKMALNMALFHAWHEVQMNTSNPLGFQVMKSKHHHDGTMFEGEYFIVMAITRVGQISYHYKLKHWNEFVIPEVDRVPKWDGHSSIQVLERLLQL